jgi:hypothetical protein
VLILWSLEARYIEISLYLEPEIIHFYVVSEIFGQLPLLHIFSCISMYRKQWKKNNLNNCEKGKILYYIIIIKLLELILRNVIIHHDST